MIQQPLVKAALSLSHSPTMLKHSLLGFRMGSRKLVSNRERGSPAASSWARPKCSTPSSTPYKRANLRRQLTYNLLWRTRIWSSTSNHWRRRSYSIRTKSQRACRSIQRAKYTPSLPEKRWSYQRERSNLLNYWWSLASALKQLCRSTTSQSSPTDPE